METDVIAKVVNIVASEKEDGIIGIEAYNADDFAPKEGYSRSCTKCRADTCKQRQREVYQIRDLSVLSD